MRLDCNLDAVIPGVREIRGGAHNGRGEACALRPFKLLLSGNP